MTNSRELYKKIRDGSRDAVEPQTRNEIEDFRYAWSAFFISTFYLPALRYIQQKVLTGGKDRIKMDVEFWDNFRKRQKELNSLAGTLARERYSILAFRDRSYLSEIASKIKLDRLIGKFFALFGKKLPLTTLEYRDFLRKHGYLSVSVDGHSTDTFEIPVRTDIEYLPATVIRTFISLYKKEHGALPPRSELERFIEYDGSMFMILKVLLSLQNKQSVLLELELFGVDTSKYADLNVDDAELELKRIRNVGGKFKDDCLFLDSRGNLRIRKDIIAKVRLRTVNRGPRMCPITYDLNEFKIIYDFWMEEMRSQFIGQYDPVEYEQSGLDD